MTNYQKALQNAVNEIKNCCDDEWPDKIDFFAVEIEFDHDVDADEVAEDIRDMLEN